VSRPNFKDKEAVNLKYVSSKDTVGALIDKINHNFREIQNNGGGPMGPIGKQGIPGCRGQNGAPGKDGENIVDEWIKKFSFGCDGDTLYNIEDVIVNKKTDRTLLLTNLSQLDLGTFELKTIGTDAISIELVIEELSNFKLKIYNSDDTGKGSHIHLANTLAMTNGFNGNEYRCKSGYSVSLDWNKSSEERLRIVGEKNNNITNHTHIFELNSDVFELKKKNDTQTWKFIPGNNVSNFNSTITLDTLTANKEVTFPNKSGYSAVWETTNEHSERWEVIDYNDIKITYTRYNPEFSNYEMGIYEELHEDDDHYIYIDDRSTIRFKRLNNWVLIDYHIGIANHEEYDDFYLRNVQFKVDKSTIGCKTLGWNVCSIVQDEDLDASDNTFADSGLFKVSSADYSGISDTFLITMRLKNGSNGMPFVNNLLEQYWLTGQIWATVQTEDTQCIELDVAQEEFCPEFEI